MTPVGVFVPEFGNKIHSGLLSAGAVKGVCPSLADGVNAEGDEGWNEDGVKGAGDTPSGREGWSGLQVFDPSVSVLAEGFISSVEIGTLRDSATAMAMADALGKRASGSFAMLLRITSDKAGGIIGLIRAGGVGSSWKCCMRIAMRESA